MINQLLPPSVVVAFSGGIDSCAVVEKLKVEGYRVTALMLSLLEGDDELIEQGRQRAEELGVEFKVEDCREVFEREIIDNFVEEYVAGCTPAPCTRCNPLIKWRQLSEYAQREGVEYIATGHYFNITPYKGKLYVSRAADSRKDQSYYLWGLSQEVLRMALTPMATEIKEEIKSRSTRSRESMGVCFLRGQHYGELIEKRGGDVRRGDIITTRGERVAEHCGLALYTVGQKRGEGIPSGRAVVEIRGKENQVVVGVDADLYKSTLCIDRCNFVDESELLRSCDIRVMIRGLGRNPEGAARVERSMCEGEYIVHLSTPAWACANGQPVVLYRGDRVIGGGYLKGAK